MVERREATFSVVFHALPTGFKVPDALLWLSLSVPHSSSGSCRQVQGRSIFLWIILMKRAEGPTDSVAVTVDTHIRGEVPVA